MDSKILKPEVQVFINQHLITDLNKLLLKGSPYENVDIRAIVEQIDAKKRCEKKLPTWFKTPNIYYPNKLNVEQTSSEETAKYKVNLIVGKSLIDLTGGFGIDDYYFSKRFDSVTHCELNDSLSKIVSHNYQQLHVDNIKTVSGDGLDYLKNTRGKFDWIYIDPSRRHDSKGKVFFLADCLPNVPEHLDFLFKKTDNILLKTSPLLDISIGLNELQHVKAIHVVSLNNEVKELLWILCKDYDHTKIEITAVNLKRGLGETFKFYMEDESQAKVRYSNPKTYIYEPNSSILKAGAFKSVAEHYNVDKLHQHTHLYTSDTLIDFPGRHFIVEEIIPYNKKTFKKTGIKKANITTRNFPDSVPQIRKKLGVDDGGEIYIFCTTDIDDNRIVLITKKA